MAERSPPQRAEKHGHDTDDEEDSPDAVRAHFTNVTAAIDKLREVCSNVGLVRTHHIQLLLLPLITRQLPLRHPLADQMLRCAHGLGYVVVLRGVHGVAARD